VVPVCPAISLQANVFSGPKVGLRFPGFPREFTGVWAPNGHRPRARLLLLHAQAEAKLKTGGRENGLRPWDPRGEWEDGRLMLGTDEPRRY
jgi:hypothetical protein